MASRYRWRNISVFLSFTGPSSVGLLIGQRNLLANDQKLASQSIELHVKAIHGMENDPARFKQQLLFHSSANITNLMKDKKN